MNNSFTNTISLHSEDYKLLDASSRLHLKKEFDALTSALTGDFRVDLQDITQVNHSGLALLVEIKKISIRKGIGLEFINIPATLLSKIEKAGLKEVFFGAFS